MNKMLKKVRDTVNIEKGSPEDLELQKKMISLYNKD